MQSNAGMQVLLYSIHDGPAFCFTIPRVQYSFLGSKATIRMQGSRMEKGVKKGGRENAPAVS